MPEETPTQLVASSSGQAAEAAQIPPAWHYIDATSGQGVGPVDAYQLAGLLDAGAITLETLVWAEGVSEGTWVPLQSQSELYAQVYYISSAGQSIAPATQAIPAGEVQEAGSAAAKLAGVAGSSKKRKAVAAAKPVMVQPVERELAEFNAEMAELGEDVNTGEAVEERAESPAPEDREFEDDDGTVYRWDPQLRKFQAQGPGANGEAGGVGETDYGMEEMTFEADEEVIPDLPKQESSSEDDEQEEGKEKKPPRHIDTQKQMLELEEQAQAVKGEGEGQAAGGKGKSKKRGAEAVMEKIAEKQKRAKEDAEKKKQWFDIKVNTSVYISGLPDDVTEAQLAERFSQYGVIKPDDDGTSRVKVYRDKATKNPKGDGLVTYLYEPSVELACKLADDDHFRPGMPRKMAVQPAKFEMRGPEYIPKKKTNKKMGSKEKAKLAEKVLGWGGFDDKVKPSQVTVILENLFHPDEILAEPTLMKDLGSDIKEESAKLGPVDKVRIFAGHPKGVVSVKFKKEDAAKACIEKMNGRFFGGRQVTASLWDGFTNYNSTKLEETEEQIAARREQFAKEIEAQEVEDKLRREQEEQAATRGLME